VVVLAVVFVVLLLPGCGVKLSQLPVVNYPYVSQMEFYKEVRNVDGKAKKKRFANDRIASPFYFFLKINDIENAGTLRVVFYRLEENEHRKAVEKFFEFGTDGKYYEYIIFFDQVEGIGPGLHRYAIFLNDRLLYESTVNVEK
jgi:hypothetical protein